MSEASDLIKRWNQASDTAEIEYVGNAMALELARLTAKLAEAEAELARLRAVVEAVRR